MTDLFRAYSARMFRHKFFIGGTILAFIITYYITANGVTMHHFGMYETDFDYSLTVSLGIPAFFALFTPFFLGTEYSDGTIRNKLAAGKTRAEIYAASFLTMTAALAVMTAAWLAGALIGANTLPDISFVATSTARLLSYNLANLAFLVMLSMSFANQRASIVIQFCLFQFGSFFALAIQGFMTIAEGTRFKVLRFMLNFFPFGQWLMSSLIGDGELMMSTGTMMGFSVFILIASTALGLSILQKKDIK